MLYQSSSDLHFAQLKCEYLQWTKLLIFATNRKDDTIFLATTSESIGGQTNLRLLKS